MIIGNGSLLLTAADSNEKFAVVVRNRSASTTSTNTLVTFTFPAGVQAANPQSNTPSQGTFDPVTGIWTVGAMLPGATETFDLQVEVLDATLRPFKVTYIVTSDQTPDQDPDNDSSSRTFDSDFACEDFADCTIFSERHGNVLYVSTQGDNSTAVKGDGHRPWRDPWAAADAADNGDTVYVYPGAYTIASSGGDVTWDGSQNLCFQNRTNTTSCYVHFHLDENAHIISTVNDPAFELFAIGLPRPEGYDISFTGNGKISIRAGVAFEVTASQLGEINIELDTFMNTTSGGGMQLGDWTTTAGNRDHLFIQGFFLGHTNIKINSMLTRGPRFLEYTDPGFNGVTNTSNNIDIQIGDWVIAPPTALDTEANAGTDDTMLRIFDQNDILVGNSYAGNYSVKIKNLQSVWKSEGLLAILKPSTTNRVFRNMNISFQIDNWDHTDAQIEAGTPYAINDNLSAYNIGTIVDAAAVGAMIKVDPDGQLNTTVDQVRISVETKNANLNGIVLANVLYGAAALKPNSSISYKAINHRQEGTPLLVKGTNSVSTNDTGFRVLVHCENGKNLNVPFFAENPTLAENYLTATISGWYFSEGAAFGVFSNTTAGRLLMIKDAVLGTDQAEIISPITASDTNSILIHSVSSNVAAEAGLTEEGQPIVIDTAYSYY